MALFVLSCYHFGRVLLTSAANHHTETMWFVQGRPESGNPSLVKLRFLQSVPKIMN